MRALPMHFLTRCLIDLGFQPKYYQLRYEIPWGVSRGIITLLHDTIVRLRYEIPWGVSRGIITLLHETIVR
jgi:hypothetical protein